MLDYVVKKVIAKEDIRIIVDSSYDELLKFEEEENLPKFNDNDVLCVKFIMYACEGDDEVESTGWYINPYYFRGTEKEYMDNITMDGEFLPEILLLGLPTAYIKKKYGAFQASLLYDDSQMTDTEKFQKFLKIHGKAIKEYRRRLYV